MVQLFQLASSLDRWKPARGRDLRADSRSSCRSGFRSLTVATIAVAWFVVFPASAATIFSHSGATDPTTEGWTANITPGNTAFSVTNDVASGVNAWATNDTSSSLCCAAYLQTPSAPTIAQATANGWIGRINMRVANTPDAPDSSVIFEYGNGTLRFNIEFGSDSSGNSIVLLATGFNGTVFTGPSVTINDPSGGYHLYELIYDPSAASADLFVDGVEVLSNYAGHAIGSTTRVAWGALSTIGTGQGNYNLVEFEVRDELAVPEPASALALLSGLVGLGVLRRRRGG